MNTTTTTELQRENDQLKAELAELKKGQESPFKSNTQLELTMHDVYLGARKKMTVGVVAVLSIVGLASGGSLYLEYKEVAKWVENTLKSTMEEQINNDVATMIEREKPKINKFINAKMANLGTSLEIQINSAKEDVDKQIKFLNEQTSDFKLKFDKTTFAIEKSLAKVASESSSAVEAIKQTLIGMEQLSKETESKAGAYSQTNKSANIAKAECNIQIADGANFSIRQLVSKTDQTYKDRPYYKNTFSVAALGDNSKEFSEATTECFVNAVDRVVYTLSERWFKPNEIVRITRNDRYSFSTNVWGSTAVKADIYIKGKTDPVQRCGRFLAKSVTPEKPEFFRSTNCS